MTAKQRLDEATGFGGKAMTRESLVQLMKDYATQVAQDTLTAAAEQVEANRCTGKSVSKCILQTPIDLP